MSDDSSSTSISEDEISNLRNMSPYEGMKVEIRDPDYIWSAATVIGIERDSSASNLQADQNNTYSKNTYVRDLTSSTGISKNNSNQSLVTLRYDGWGDEWNEVLPWCHPRLAKLFTYTKKVKCFVHIPGISLSPDSPYKRNKKKNYNGFVSVWPCSVCFRMPHPGSEQSKISLKMENKIFTQPFGNSLPKRVLSFFNNKKDGGWIHGNKLRQWRAYSFDKIYWQFEDACQLAEAASLGNLPVKPFEHGTLLRDIYLTKKIGGDPFEGGHPGAFPLVPPRGNSKTTGSSQNKNVIDATKSESDSYSDESSNEEYCPPTYEPPPTLPSPIKIKEATQPNIKFLEKTKKWGLTTNSNGNDIFIGSFPSQSQAIAMEKLAHREFLRKSTDDGDEQRKKLKTSRQDFEMFHNDSRARETDLKFANLEACITPVQNWKDENKFSMHDWTMQSIRHDEYLFEKANGKAAFEKQKMMRKNYMDSHKNLAVRKNKRKQTKPLKVDLLRKIYYP